MNDHSQPRRDRLRREAAELIAKAHATRGWPQDDSALASWRDQDVDHQAAYAEVSGTWDGLGDIAQHPALTGLLGQPTLRERWTSWRRRPRLNLQPQQLAFASVAMALICGAVWFTGDRLRRTDFETKIAQVQNVPLADGSVVTLGAKSAIAVHFEPNVRRVKLAGGEAFFAVSKNPKRPFIVEAGDTQIRVVGTKFNVNMADGNVRVTVQEGVVQVTRAGISQWVGAPPKMVRITANQEAVDPAGQPGPVIEPAPISEPGAWRDGRLGYEDAPLSQVIADVNRYRSAPVRLDTEEVGDLRVTTSFKVSQIEAMLQALPQSIRVEVRRRSDGTIEIGPS